MAIGKLHLLVLHFPLALIIAAALADVLWLWLRRGVFREAGYYCLLAGAIAAIPTAITGSLLFDSPNLVVSFPDMGETHESLGIITAVIAALAAVLRAVMRNKLSGIWAYAYGLLIAAAVVLVAATGHTGGLLAFGKGYLSGLF